MRFSAWRGVDGTRKLYIEFSEYDMIRVPLDKVDLAMLTEPAITASDHLMDAELIARRLERLDARPTQAERPNGS